MPFDADQHEGFPYIVMEYLEGEDLEKMLRRRGLLPPQEVIDCMIQAARGLAHAHEKRGRPPRYQAHEPVP